MDEEKLTFHDITDASRFIPEAPFPWSIVAFILLGLLFFLIIAVLIYFKIKSSKKTVVRQNGFNLALDELEGLKPRLESLTLGETAKQLSFIMRKALKLGTDSPALFKTQQESHSQSAIVLPNKDLEQKVKAHLDELWNLEYTPSENNFDKAKSLFNDTHGLLTHLKN